MEFLVFMATGLAAYLLGSIPTGYVVGRARGVDIRTLGSGNIGATNVFRFLGTASGVFVLLVDALKGFVACHNAGPVSWGLLYPNTPTDAVSLDYLELVGGVGVILGHNYTFWLRFKGGKGIATSAGVLAAWVPWTCVIGMASWGIVVLLTRYVSLGSIAAAVSLPIGTWLTGGSSRFIAVTAIISSLAIYKHKANIQRLLQGTEPRLGAKKPEPPKDSAP